MINGVVFQLKGDSIYKGIEGNNWYLNDLYPEIFESYFDENYYYVNSEDIVMTLNNKELINKYIELSKLHNKDYRILLCETEKNHPTANNLKWDMHKFIGYDFAYSGDDYYSAIYNEVIDSSKYYHLFDNEEIKLNQNKLFDTIKDVKEFIIKREKIINNGIKLETGDFIIYKLYEVNDLLT